MSRPARSRLSRFPSDGLVEGQAVGVADHGWLKATLPYPLGDNVPGAASASDDFGLGEDWDPDRLMLQYWERRERWVVLQ